MATKKVPSLDTRAEVIKLARLLGVSAAALEDLHALPAAALAQLRESLNERFYGGHRALFQKIASAARLVPNAINARISQKVFGPVLSARIAGEMPVKPAVDMAARMPVDFLCDLALELDPRRARDIVRAMPADIAVGVALEMQRRGEFVIMGRFVDHMSDAAIDACLQALSDERVLLDIGKFMEARHRVGDMLRRLPAARQRKLLLAAAADEQLLDDLRGLLPHLDATLKQQLRARVADQDPALVALLA